MIRKHVGVQQSIVRFGIWNAPFVLALFIGAWLPGVLRVLLVTWILFVAPGLAFTDRRGHDAFTIVASAIVRSTVVVMVSWIVVALLPGPVHRELFLITIALVVNFGLVRGSRRGWFPELSLRSPFAKALGIAAFLFFVQSYVGAAYRIPALEDQDMEVQGTAYGLVHSLRPTMVTNRGTTNFFAHPPLLHAWIGLSMLVTDELDDLRFYHEAAMAARGESREQLDARFRETFARFEQAPHLLGTRTPTVIMGVMTMILFALLIRELTGSAVAAVGGAVLYATLPEVYVRSAYGGYMTVTSLWGLLVIRSYLSASGLLEGGTRSANLRAVLGGSALGAVANSKSVMIAVATVLHGCLTALADAFGNANVVFWRNRKLVASAAVALGFWMGWLLFAAWGVGISRADFVEDHMRVHFLDRFQFNTVWLQKPTGSLDKYPSIGALWAQYAKHIGWPIAGVGMLALARAMRRFKGADGVLLMWFAVGGIMFSITDWRQTKHLALILPPLLTLIAMLWSGVHGRARFVLTVVLTTGLVLNVWRVAMLMIDFTYLVPYRMW